MADDIHKINTERSSLKSQYPQNRFTRSRTTTKPSLQENPTPQPTKRCFRCGGRWPHNDRKCSAEGQQCNYRLKHNHFVRVCQSRNQTQHRNSANAVHNTPDNSQFTNIGQDEDTFYTKLKLGKSTVKFQIDRGSSGNVIDESTFAIIQLGIQG